MGGATATPVNVTQLVAEVAALRRLAANMTAAAAEIAALRLTVADLEHDAGRSLLGGDAFDSTAFFVALFVAAYQLVPNPTGDQGATDASELLVYHQWRTAAIALTAYVAFAVAVAVQQLRAGWGGSDLWWLLALMLAPWAPVAGQVRRTIVATRRVRAMMRSRGCRNRLTGVLREYLAVGHPSLVPTVVARERLHVVLSPPLWVPRSVAPAGAEDEALDAVAMNLGYFGFATAAEDLAGEAVADSYESAEKRARRVVRLDPLAWAWSRAANAVLPSSPLSGGVGGLFRHAVGETPLLSPFEYPPVDAAHDAARAKAGVEVNLLRDIYTRRPLVSSEETLVLDAIDGVLPGGTLSTARIDALRDSCDRCVTAYRAAVELFTESSGRGHEGIDAAAWFRDFSIAPPWALSRAVRTLRAAALVDGGGAPVDVASSAGGGSGKGWTATKATDQVLFFLFLVARSLLGGSGRLDGLRQHVTARYHSAAWWDDYWVALGSCLRQSVADGGPPPWATSVGATGRVMCWTGCPRGRGSPRQEPGADRWSKCRG